jgi:hypothetical protein
MILQARIGIEDSEHDKLRLLEYSLASIVDLNMITLR